LARGEGEKTRLRSSISGTFLFNFGKEKKGKSGFNRMWGKGKGVRGVIPYYGAWGEKKTRFRSSPRDGEGGGGRKKGRESDRRGGEKKNKKMVIFYSFNRWITQAEFSYHFKELGERKGGKKGRVRKRARSVEGGERRRKHVGLFPHSRLRGGGKKKGVQEKKPPRATRKNIVCDKKKSVVN